MRFVILVARRVAVGVRASHEVARLVILHGRHAAVIIGDGSDLVFLVVRVMRGRPVLSGHRDDVARPVVDVSFRPARRCLGFQPVLPVVGARFPRPVWVFDKGRAVHLVIMVDRDISLVVGRGRLTVCISKRGRVPVRVRLRDDAPFLIVSVGDHGVAVCVLPRGHQAIFIIMVRAPATVGVRIGNEPVVLVVFIGQLSAVGARHMGHEPLLVLLECERPSRGKRDFRQRVSLVVIERRLETKAVGHEAQHAVFVERPHLFLLVHQLPADVIPIRPFIMYRAQFERVPGRRTKATVLISGEVQVPAVATRVENAAVLRLREAPLVFEAPATAKHAYLIRTLGVVAPRKGERAAQIGDCRILLLHVEVASV